jgi:hypothetical protein
MAGRSIANRSETVTVSTPRGPVEVVRKQWRSQGPGSRWASEWLARRRGQRDWRQGSTAREAIRQAALLPPGKHPAWLLDAAGERNAGGGVVIAEAEAYESAGRLVDRSCEVASAQDHGRVLEEVAA